MKTILIHTNSGRLHNLCSGLFQPFTFTRPQVQAVLGNAPTTLFDLNGRKLIAVPDSWTDVEWLQALLGTLTGELHVVRHTAPIIALWTQAVPILDGAQTRLGLSYGTQGRHEAHRNDDLCKPYCWLADLVHARLTNDQNAVTAWPFDTVWAHLETHHPIENLLADQLDYLHSVMATGKAPEKVGTALNRAIAAAEKQSGIYERLEKLGKPYETSQYATFTELRDLILGLKEPVKPA